MLADITGASAVRSNPVQSLDAVLPGGHSTVC
jgi:hypothetical protein